MTDRAALVMEHIHRLQKNKETVLVAIDGRCASGKTTLAAELQAVSGCNVLHMDDFFLRQEQRTEKRLREPGGNVDYERFLEETLLPLHRGEVFSYRAYDCHTRQVETLQKMFPKPVNIIEGSYSCHPALWNYYDLHIFLSVDKEEQMRRIVLRNKEMAGRFKDTWIPLEERYFSAFRLEQQCELYFS